MSEHGSKIKWGAIVAGAAIATGILLFAPTLMKVQVPGMAEGLLSKLSAIGGKIGDVILSMFSKTPTTISPETVETIKRITGVALIGGGTTYLMNQKKDYTPVYREAEASEGFATRLEMDKAQKLMTMRLAYAGHPEAQAALQQAGRA